MTTTVLERRLSQSPTNFSTNTLVNHNKFFHKQKCASVTRKTTRRSWHLDQFLDPKHDNNRRTSWCLTRSTKLSRKPDINTPRNARKSSSRATSSWNMSQTKLANTDSNLEAASMPSRYEAAAAAGWASGVEQALCIAVPVIVVETAELGSRSSTWIWLRRLRS